MENYNGKIGDILICKRNSWISKGIKLITKGTYSHTALYAKVWDRSGVIEAQSNGVNFKLWNVWKRKWSYKIVVFRPKFPVDEKQFMLKAFEKCGETKYDFFTFFRRALGNRKKRSARKENKKYICSEFTAYMHNLPEGYDMTPQEQYDYLVRNSNWDLVYKD